MKKQLISADESTTASTQHTLPCSDCPFARISLQGWLGSMTVEEWIQAVHGEVQIDCHVIRNQQCAGAAIYRANVAKLPRSPKLLRLASNREIVFANPKEFSMHHQKSRA